MEIQLIQGQFDKTDAKDLITKMIYIKIKYHENKIDHSSNEEDIKMRETRIRQLQKDLHNLRKELDTNGSNSKAVTSQIEIG